MGDLELVFKGCEESALNISTGIKIQNTAVGSLSQSNFNGFTRD